MSIVFGGFWCPIYPVVVHKSIVYFLLFFVCLFVCSFLFVITFLSPNPDAYRLK